MDAPVQDPRELGASLAQVAQANRWFGGVGPLRRALDPLRRGGRDVLLLDVGAGNGEVAAGLARWGSRGGGRWRAVALDLHRQTVRVARDRVEGAADVVQGDGLRLPFRDGSVDVAVAVLVLHHLDDGPAATLVAEMARVARWGILVNDLERHAVSHFLARCLAATLWRRNRLTRHDGPLSVLRGFTPRELLEIGERAGLREPRVSRHLPWRLLLRGHGRAGGPGNAT